jgi:NhaP-type Na+/H+ and K+/H+ antiporter
MCRVLDRIYFWHIKLLVRDTPIVFALIPLIQGESNAGLILNMVSVLVVASMLLHGFTLKPAAKMLNLLKEENPVNE